jgi:hypothetical protein
VAKWIQNLIGLAFVVVLVGVAKKIWFDAADAEVSIT